MNEPTNDDLIDVMMRTSWGRRAVEQASGIWEEEQPPVVTSAKTKIVWVSGTTSDTCPALDLMLTAMKDLIEDRVSTMGRNMVRAVCEQILTAMLDESSDPAEAVLDCVLGDGL